MTNTPIQVTTDLNKILDRIEQNLNDFRKESEQNLNDFRKESEQNLNDFRKESNQKLDKIDERLTKLEIAQVRMEANITTLDRDVREIKGTQKAQIWALIGTMMTAILGILTALGRLIFFPANP
jgi:ElaB/YqjD/DUF883 family membrane-anchored ribosome-binding protein